MPSQVPRPSCELGNLTTLCLTWSLHSLFLFWLNNLFLTNQLSRSFPNKFVSTHLTYPADNVDDIGIRQCRQCRKWSTCTCKTCRPDIPVGRPDLNLPTWHYNCYGGLTWGSSSDIFNVGQKYKIHFIGCLMLINRGGEAVECKHFQSVYSQSCTNGGLAGLCDCSCDIALSEDMITDLFIFESGTL